MKIKISITRLYTGLFLLLALLSITSCSDWKDIESVDIAPQNAKDQNPELWARYMESLRVYKQERPHYITYSSFDNGAEESKNEGAYLRSLPDSLDIVTLANSENISTYDREDIPLLQEKSTKVLYRVDYASQAAILSDAAKLGAFLDKAIATATELNLNGFAFTGMPLYSGTEAELAARKEAAKLIVSRLSAAASGDKLLVLDGDPAFVETSDIEKLDYIVLNTVDITNVTTLKLLVTGLLDNQSLPKEKLLLAAKINNQIIDETNVKQDAVTVMTERVVSLGPLGGLAIFATGDDYYQTKMHYAITRTAIQLMNPSN